MAAGRKTTIKGESKVYRDRKKERGEEGEKGKQRKIRIEAGMEAKRGREGKREERKIREAGTEACREGYRNIECD